MLAPFQAYRILERQLTGYLRNHFKAPQSYLCVSTAGKSADPKPGHLLKSSTLPLPCPYIMSQVSEHPVSPTGPLLPHLWPFNLTVPSTWPSLPPAQFLPSHYYPSGSWSNSLKGNQKPYSSGTAEALYPHLSNCLSSCAWYHSYQVPMESPH